MRFALPLAALFLPIAAFAHEVYVLDPSTVAADIAATSPNPLFAYFGNEQQFFFWGFVSFVTVSTILCASAFRLFEKRLDPFFFRIKRFALPLIRLTVGLSLVVFGAHNILFGPELPLASIGASMLQTLLVALGVLVLAGAFTRYAAALALVMYAYAVWASSGYALLYLNHAGAYAVLLVLGGGAWSLDSFTGLGKLPQGIAVYMNALRPYALPFFRMLFGTSIVLAALYAKFLHSQLALDVVARYHLTSYFPFDPLFVVLGALIIETLAGLMLVSGIEIRWTGLFLLFWIFLGQFSMDEGWWVHIILIGGGLAIFCHGYDRYSLEGVYLKRHGHEPLL